MSKAHRVVSGSVAIVFLIGIVKSVRTQGKLPSARFFFGSGILYLILSGIAEAEPEIAQNLALAIVTVQALTSAPDLAASVGIHSSQTGTATPAQLPRGAAVQTATVRRREPAAPVAGQVGATYTKPLLTTLGI